MKTVFVVMRSNPKDQISELCYGPFHDYFTAYDWAEKQWNGRQFAIWEVHNPENGGMSKK